VTPDLAIVQDPAQTPGAWERELSREVPGGLVVYREAPAGWLCKDGSVRARPYREYVWAPEGGPMYVRLPSVSTILDAICPKGGLPYWSEAKGIEGAVLALKAGLVYEHTRAEDAIALVREHGLGAEAAKGRAATRGLNVHAINESWMRTGEAPKLSDHPSEHHGYIRSWVRMVLALKPEPVEVEQLVVHGDDGYAGRLDMRARFAGRLRTCDIKTQENGAIYPAAHVQVRLYERGAVWSGDEPAEDCQVIVLPANGDWNAEQHTMLADHHDWQIDAALAWWRAKRPIDSACNSRNRAVRP
jgi:hypothetical protein